MKRRALTSPHRAPPVLRGLVHLLRPAIFSQQKLQVFKRKKKIVFSSFPFVTGHPKAQQRETTIPVISSFPISNYAWAAESKEEAEASCSKRGSTLADLQDQEILEKVFHHCFQYQHNEFLNSQCKRHVLYIDDDNGVKHYQAANYWTRQRPACGDQTFWWVAR